MIFVIFYENETVKPFFCVKKQTVIHLTRAAHAVAARVEANARVVFGVIFTPPMALFIQQLHD